MRNKADECSASRPLSSEGNCAALATFGRTYRDVVASSGGLT